MTTLTQLYEEVDGKRASYLVLVDGIQATVEELDVNAGFGQARDASFTLANPPAMPIDQGAEVAIYTGYNGLLNLRFTGIVTNIAPNAVTTAFECTGEGRKLKHSYQRIVRTIAGEDANDVVRDLLDDAGVTNYIVNLEPWTIGAVVTSSLEFESYGDAVDDIALVDGSPWHEVASGQIRVERRDPWPSISAFRRYFSGMLSQLTQTQRQQALAGTLPAVDLQPPAIVAAGASIEARPRIRPSISQMRRYEEVKNRVRVMGAVLDITDSNGASSSQRIEGAAQGPSPWIETPPGFRDEILDFPLIDTQAKADATAVRYFLLADNLGEEVPLEVDGDPEIELGMTVQVEDPDYSGITGNWFVMGFRERMSSSEYTTELDLRGGIRSGVTPQIFPIAEFITAVGGKTTALAQVLPAGAGTIVTFDGRASYDPDGTIVNYEWSDDQGNFLTGADKAVVQFAYDEAITSVEMTLTVTDNDGLTDSITKTVRVNNTDPCGNTATCTIFAAIKTHASVTTDGGKTWTDKTKASLGVTGDVVSLEVRLHYYVGPDAKDAEKVAFFGTTAGELIITTNAFSTFLKFNLPVAEEIVGIYTTDIFDSGVGEHYDDCFVVTATGRAYFFILRHANNDYGLVGFYNDGLVTTGLVKGYQRGLDTRSGETVFNDFGAVMIIGGDTGQPSSLLRSLSGQVQGTSVGGTFVFAASGFFDAVPAFSPELIAAIAAAGPGFKIVGAYDVINTQIGPFGQHPSVLTIIFDGGVTPRVWYWNSDTGAWTPATGLTGGVNGKAIAPGYDIGNSLAALNQLKTFAALDGIAFVEGSSGSPSQINKIEWELGQKDVYLGAAAGGIVKSLDFGDSWGYIRPHAGIGTTWPGGAEGRAVSLTPSNVPPCANVFAIQQNIATDNSELWALSARQWVKVSGLATPAFGLRYFKEGHFLHLVTDDTVQISNDYGVTWSGGAPPDGTHVRCHDVQADASGERLWGLWRDGNGNSADYVIARSDDFGATWETKYNVPDDWTFTIACHPSDPMRLAVAGQVHGDLGAFVWISLNGGETWTRRDGPSGLTFPFLLGFPRRAIGYIGSPWLCWTPYGRLLSLQDLSSQIHYSDDAAVNWTAATTPSLSSAAPYQLFRIGTFGPFFALRDDAMMKSIDFGLNWTEVTPPANPAYAGAAYNPLVDALIVQQRGEVLGNYRIAAILAPLTNETFQDWSYNLEAVVDNGNTLQSLAFVQDPQLPET